MSRRAVASGLLVAVVLPGCAATTYDASLETQPAGAVTTTTAPVLADTPLGELLTELRGSMRSLDEQVVDGDGDDETLARIDALWAVAAGKVQDERPDLWFGLQQAVRLAHTGVERRRPADASKGYLLVVPLVDDYLAG
jgi:hypothetical protein